MHCYFSGDFNVSCEDVTGTVSEEVNFNCSVSLKKSKCCIKLYKFQYPKNISDSEICREEFPPDSCEQRNSFTCSFTPTTVMKEQFRFFIQPVCGVNTTEFTVNITGTVFNTAIIQYMFATVLYFQSTNSGLKCVIRDQ